MQWVGVGNCEHLDQSCHLKGGKICTCCKTINFPKKKKKNVNCSMKFATLELCVNSGVIQPGLICDRMVINEN
jgi:hypothetical protein